MDWETINVTRELILKWITKDPTIAEYNSIKKLIRTYGKLANIRVDKILNNNPEFDQVAFYRIVKFLSLDDNELSTISNCLSIKNQLENIQLKLKEEELWQE